MAPTQPVTPSANAIYFDRQKTCRVLLAELRHALDTHRATQQTRPTDWGYAGDLGKMEADLRDLLTFVRSGAR